MDIGDLTINQARELSMLFGSRQGAIDGYAIGEVVIIRTYSAGVWCGTLAKKAGKEVILEGARRMWRWHAASSISLSAVAVSGINRDKSKIAPAVPSVWLEAIEIIPVSQQAKKSIMEAEDVAAS